VRAQSLDRWLACRPRNLHRSARAGDRLTNQEIGAQPLISARRSSEGAVGNYVLAAWDRRYCMRALGPRFVVTLGQLLRGAAGNDQDGHAGVPDYLGGPRSQEHSRDGPDSLDPITNRSPSCGRRPCRAHRGIGPLGVGRGLLGGLAVVVIALASIGSGNDGLRHIAGATDHRGPGAQAGVRRPPCSGAVSGRCAP
jgi:hypothetical protein